MMKNNLFVSLSLLITFSIASIGVAYSFNQQKEENKVARVQRSVSAYSGVIEEGRYLIEAKGTSYGLSASSYPNNTPPAKNIDSLVGWDFSLVSDNTYTISTYISGVTYYLCLNDGTASNTSLRSKANTERKNWTISIESDYYVITQNGRYVAYGSNTFRSPDNDAVSAYNKQMLLVPISLSSNDLASIISDEVTCYNGEKAPLIEGWNYAYKVYGYLSSSEQEILRNTEAKASGTSMEEAMYKYDMIVSKYEESGYTNFISRNVSNTSIHINTYITGENNNYTSVIVISSCTIMIMFLTIILIKKRKRKCQ